MVPGEPGIPTSPEIPTFPSSPLIPGKPMSPTSPAFPLIPTKSRKMLSDQVTFWAVCSSFRESEQEGEATWTDKGARYNEETLKKIVATVFTFGRQNSIAR